MRQRTPLDQSLREIRRLLSQATAADSASIIIRNQAGRVVQFAIDERVPQASGWIIVGEATQRGVVNRVIRDKESLLIEDLDSCEDWYPRGLSSQPARSLLCVPLLSSARVLGAICLTHPLPKHFGHADEDLVQRLADAIALIVENRQLREETDWTLRRRVSELSTLNALATIAGRSLDERQTVSDALSIVCQALGTEAGMAYLLDADKNALFRCATWGLEDTDPADLALAARIPLGRGLAGRSVLSKAPIVAGVNDYSDPVWRKVLLRKGVRTIMATPLTSRDTVQGAVCLLTRHDRPATKKDLSLLASIGGQLGVAVENARLFNQAQRRSQELEAINTVMQGLTQTLVLDDVLYRIHGQVTRLMKADVFFVGLLNDEGDHVYPKLAIDKGEHQEPPPLPLTGGNSLIAYVVASGESLLFYDLRAQKQSLPAPGLVIGEEPRSWLGVPMILEDHIIGAMSVQSYSPDCFTEADRRVLSVIAQQTAAAISQARLFEQLQARMQDLQAAQARLMQSEKMAALGELVSGVAHELNNPLTAVIGYAQLLRLRDLDDDTKHDLQRIYEAAQRSSQIATDLLTFARSYEPERSAVDINAALEQTLSLRAYEMRVHNIVLATELWQGLPLTVGDPHRLKQVFLNLIINAEQAMGEADGGGVLTVRSLMPADRPGIIHLEFEDSGPGINPEVMGRIFDPFFTTKEVGQGTGLGLSICYGIIAEHGGTIWAENLICGDGQDRQGAKFIIELPIVSAADTGVKLTHGAEEVHEQPFTPLRMLVVDDEPDVADLIRRIVQSAGHTVVTASDGAQALTLLERDHFDIVFCDLKMPGMSGKTLYQAISEKQPETARRFVFVSGDTVSTDTKAFISDCGRTLVMKPFSVTEILGIVARTTKREESARG